MKKQIKISKKLYDKINRRIDDSEFTCVDDYVEYILSSVMHKYESKNILEQEEEKEIKNRLRDLGYLD